MEKLDTLIGIVIGLRTSVRLCLCAVAIGCSMVVVVMSFALVGVIQTSNEVDRLLERTVTIEKQTEQMNARLEKLERK
jgi:uncharacterized membrane protein (Fun14 family)